MKPKPQPKLKRLTTAHFFKKIRIADQKAIKKPKKIDKKLFAKRSKLWEKYNRKYEKIIVPENDKKTSETIRNLVLNCKHSLLTL